MNIRHTNTPFFALICLLAGMLQSPRVRGQACDNPVVLSSVLISNATCGNATGAIILNLGSGAYQFNWSPSVSVSNVASNLQAGTYAVEILRADNPNCRLDTTIIVNNSNGPAVQISSSSPANCLASNGQITLAPATLTYSWSNGASGPVNSGLAAGCYYVTATNASNCYSVQKICIANTNPLQTQVVVLQNAKCGLPSGAANVVVQGGSGQYTYTLGPEPPFAGLAAGLYFIGVSDDLTGCTEEVSFIIEDIPVSGSVDLLPVPVKCPGQSNGSIGIAVTPGENFSLPYSTDIRNASGLSVQASNLAPGLYYIQISDAQGCLLPLDSFEIESPEPFLSQALVIPGDCTAGGQILLSVSGGTGPKTVDWNDLPGALNTQNRQNLAPGLYSAVVSDSLGCSFQITPVLVGSDCIDTDSVQMQVTVSSVDTFCMNLPPGVDPETTTFALIGSGSSTQGNSAFGSWNITENGCLLYTAGVVAGMGVDTICLASNTGQSALNDTICLIINILEESCPPIHNYATDSSGTIAWMIADCNGDSVFCSTILGSAISEWAVTDFSLPVEISSCGNLAGFVLDTGLHLLRLQHLQSPCAYEVRIWIRCMPSVPADTTYAVADEAYTNTGTSVDLALLANDVVLGNIGDAGALSAVDFLSAPDAGTYYFNPVTGLFTFQPADNQCGVLKFTYQITDSLGFQSSADISISVICDKILIFNGISPNGDSLNDEWHMPGIDQYPNNEVRVFNRWGQLVFERSGYTNATGWDGRWNGKDLPDGTYFYTIDLKDGSPSLSGYLQILR